MLDSLGDAAKGLGDKAKAHNEKLEVMKKSMDKATDGHFQIVALFRIEPSIFKGVARVNERAAFNVKYLS